MNNKNNNRKTEYQENIVNKNDKKEWWGDLKFEMVHFFITANGWKYNN